MINENPTIAQEKNLLIVSNNLYGKKRMDMFICVTDSLCCTSETNTTL